MSVAMIVLNYKRPWNLDRSMPIISGYVDIDEIHVLNGHPASRWENQKSLPKVFVHEDYENNQVFYAARRYLAASNVTEAEYIITLDDDELPDELLIKNLIAHVKDDDTRWYGALVRNCTTGGYFTKVNKDNYNVVLNPTAVARRHVDKYAKTMLLNEHKRFLQSTKGNGDDLLFNYFMRVETGNLPKRVMTGTLEFMDHDNGYHTLSNHYKIREMLCKVLNENPEKLNTILDTPEALEIINREKYRSIAKHVSVFSGVMVGGLLVFLVVGRIHYSSTKQYVTTWRFVLTFVFLLLFTGLLSASIVVVFSC
jgi:hypothetical protein